MASHTVMKKGCCCLGPLIVVVVIILALIIGTVTVINMTPNQLKIGDYQLFGDKSINDLGMGDIKIKEVFKFISNLASPNRDEIVDKPYDPAVESANAENNFGGTVNELPRTPGGDIDYTALLEDNIIYDNQYLLEYMDTTLAYIFNETMGQAQENSGEEHLNEIGAVIEQISIFENGGTYRLKIVFSAAIFGSKEEIKANLGGNVPDFVVNNLPDRIYFTSYSNLSADGEGKITAEAAGVSVNGMDASALTDAIISALSEDGEELDDTMGEAFAGVVYKLGKVGTADKDANNVITGNIVLGAAGIHEGKITVITHTAP